MGTSRTSLWPSSHPGAWLVRAIVAAVTVALVAGAFVPVNPAEAHTSGGIVHVYNPVVDGDSVHNDVTAYWAKLWDTDPQDHHIVYSNWGYMNDWSVDIYGVPGRRIVSPFGTKTTAGHPTQVKVVRKVPACASGKIADGGWRITVEVKNKTTGQVLGRADIAHVNSPQVNVGQILGPWTTIGYVGSFNYGAWSSCYQVTNSSGTHVHLEIINKHRYACFIPRANGAALTGLTKIGNVAIHKAGQRAAC